jgi:ariadne-1
MTEYCLICGIYENIDNFKDLSCGCKFCKASVGHWVVAQLDNYHKDNFIVTCPLGMLGHDLNDYDLKMCLTEEQLEQYENVRLKKHLLKKSEYIICPMNHCNYIGWVDKKGGCSESLICGKCNGQWTDPSLLPAYTRLYAHVIGFFFGTSDFWNFIWKEIWVKYCPKCESTIEKNGGCLHMTCRSCSYEFCWICLQSYRNHLSELCRASIGYFWGLILMIMIGVIIRLYLASNTFAGVFNYLIYEISLVFVGVVTCFVITGTIVSFAHYRKGDYFDTVGKVFLGIGIICSFAVLCALIYFYWFLLEILELGLLLGLALGANLVSCFIIYKYDN